MNHGKVISSGVKFFEQEKSGGELSNSDFWYKYITLDLLNCDEPVGCSIRPKE